jgi:xanthine dehydrogenase YagS FAD-binding subunit
MMPFEFLRVEDVAGAVAAVTEHPDAVYLAGGTNLVDHMKLGVATPNLVVDISHLPLDQIVELPDGTVRIGAIVRNSDLAAHLLIRQRYPVLSQALLAGASGQLRNLATTAGTYCSAPDASTSKTSACRATSAIPARAVRRGRAIPATTRSSVHQRVV